MADDNEKTLEYSDSDRVAENVNIVGDTGTDSFNIGDNKSTYLASSEYTQWDTTKPEAQDTTQRADSELRKEWTVKKPSEVVENIQKYPDSETLEKAEDKYKKNINDLDETDQHGRRVGAYRESYHTAERVKVLESVKKYEQELLAGKELTEEEKQLIYDRKLKSNDNYQETKRYYEKKGLSKDDRDTLLQKHFKKDMDNALESIKDENGVYNSKKLNIEEMLALKNKYKSTVTTEFFKDNRAKQEESTERYKENQQKKFVEENPDWSAEEERRKQEQGLIKKERDLYKEAVVNNAASAAQAQTTPITPVTPVAPITPTPVIVTPMPSTTPDKKDAIAMEKDNRRRSTIALVAGVVVGSAAGLAGGASVAAVVVTAGGIGSLTSGAVQFAANKFRESYIKKIALTTDPVEKEKLEKRKDLAEKISKAAGHIKKFFMGGVAGGLLSGLVSQVFMGGQGVFTHFAGSSGVEQTAATATTPSSGVETTPSGIENAQASTGSTDIPTGSIETPTPSTDSVLVENGRVNLDGSAWDGNLAGEHVGNLQGEALNQSNYTGGIHEMAPHMLENDLLSSGITRQQLLDNMGTSGVHDLLNAYVNQIRGGIADPNLPEVLQSINTDGAKNLLSIIK